MRVVESRKRGHTVFIIGDILLFITTALVLSITCLCILLHVRARDAYTKGFLTVLIPLCLQMNLTLLMTYIPRVYDPSQLSGETYEAFCLVLTVVSIFLTTTLLLVMSRYLIDLLPATEKQKHLGNRLVLAIITLYLVLSLYFIILRSEGNWTSAMDYTFRYHFFSGSMLMVVLGITSLIYRKKATLWEEEQLLRGISITFLPLVITFPLDLIFFRHHAFKLAYLSFSIFVVYLYFFISRRYFQKYEVSYQQLTVQADILRAHGISIREEEIIRLLVQGKTNREIAEKLFISTNTVKTHVKNIYGKLNVSNRVQLFSLLKENPTP
ncbi:response regulator containing a CheY-like receiver domain and an HTH DNA-binding domain [Sphaerochaeta pleomorpha str. Grapes]|uniref:Response regulator containing a CheY-like receiver domain and an HTH DNA-binding domain n=1 Tax=Sphaerochaeta pleomorpha (strain ATCC BAA-1885 / DSM 22778 / Grapes) TaxID=158190 RepID=G8QS15_SPHPG|nr:response regulator containing a CheY-like receiver domain and an HTH DNA-binding domain [Sphaerochaeta pleomorpha str. Grapes]